MTALSALAALSSRMRVPCASIFAVSSAWDILEQGEYVNYKKVPHCDMENETYDTKLIIGLPLAK